jgi:hypothetical protein
MGLLGKILLNEGITVFRCDVLIKTRADQNKVEIYNEIRALEGVVVVLVIFIFNIIFVVTDKDNVIKV